MKPIRAALSRHGGRSADARTRSVAKRSAGLRAQIEAVTSGQAQLAPETGHLVAALRRPEVRGRWGEISAAARGGAGRGLTGTRRFHRKDLVTTAEGSLRPDLVVHMPDERDLVVDAKTPLDAYLEAVEAGQRRGAPRGARRSPQQMEAHIANLRQGVLVTVRTQPNSLCCFCRATSSSPLRSPSIPN